jgi:hypothetical protein
VINICPAPANDTRLLVPGLLRFKSLLSLQLT